MKHLFILLLAAASFMACSCTTADDGIKVLAVKEFAEACKCDTSCVVLDVRTPGEYAEGHLEGALNVNFKDAAAFEEGIARLDTAKTYYVYCRSGRRSHGAAVKMREKGLKTIDMEGGITAWKNAGMPVQTSAE